VEAKDFSDPDLRYGNGTGFPSGLIEQAAYATWTGALFDGALAHLANSVQERARKTLGFSANFGPVAHFERRPNVEGTFNAIAKRLFHHSPATTGSNPFNGKAEDAEEKAVEYRLHASLVEDISEIYFAQHNAIPTSGQYSRSPLDTLRQYFGGTSARCEPRKLSSQGLDAARTFASREFVIVRGSISSGRRPYVTIDKVRYTSNILAEAGDLIGTRLTVDIDEDDMRQVKAFLPNGAELGFLIAGGKWSLTKHDRKTRKAINSLLYKRVLVLSKFDDPVVTFLRYLNTQKTNNKKNKSPINPKQATDAARVASAAELPLEISRSPRDGTISTIVPLTTREVVTRLKPVSVSPTITKIRNRR
jgi:putative transposase